MYFKKQKKIMKMRIKTTKVFKSDQFFSKFLKAMIYLRKSTKLKEKFKKILKPQSKW